MKKLFISVIALSLAAMSYGQDAHIKGKAIGLSFFLNDFKTAALIRANGLSHVLNEGTGFDIGNMNAGLAFNYMSGLSKHMDFIATLGGSFLEYPINGQPTFTNDNFLLEATAAINFKLLSDRHTFTPFFDLGVGASKYSKYYSAFIPAGIGLQANMNDKVFLLLNSQYRIPVTSRASYHFYHSISIVTTISERKEETPPIVVEIPVISDRDADGIVDSLDKCPDAAGISALQGCPDRDGDGIADREDACADVPGLAKYKGCPVPDTDKDGMNDEEDKCPNVQGVARYGGCPVPDSDGDGVNDEEDKCPNQVGPASNKGCPEIDAAIVEKVNKAAGKIYFTTGSSKLLAKSNKSLNEVVSILKNNPSFIISIDGYTDNTGSDELNQKLSEARAQSVKEYLIKNDIQESRIKSLGHGEENPVADNDTAAGRKKNRRVELTLKNY